MAMRWYVIHAYSGFEQKVADFIKEQAEKKGLSSLVEEVIVPTEKVMTIQNGTKKESSRKFFPGYVLAKMEMTDATWYLVTKTPKVTGFLGGKKPQAITEEEAKRILNQVEEGVTKPRSAVTYVVGEQVQIMDGPFVSFVGEIQEVDAEKERLKLQVSIFGRPTPVELTYAQVKKV